MRAATRVNAEQASKRLMWKRRPVFTVGKAAIGREERDTGTVRFHRGIGGGTHGRGIRQQHGKPLRWRMGP